MKRLFAIAAIFLTFCSLVSAQAPQWKLELDEPIKDYHFINDNSMIFMTNGEYVWCYNVESGSEVWSMEIPDFEEEGISLLLGEMFLTNSDNKLQAYDAITGKLMWENEYDDIDQADYTSAETILNNAVFRYGDIELGIDLNNGNELFRMEVDYWGELVDMGTFNYSVLSPQKKMLVMEDSEIASIFDVTTGAKVFTAEEYDINTDLIENKFPWMYKSPDQDFILMVLDNGAAAIDVKNNKEFGRKEFSIDGDLNVLLPTSQGCAVMGEEKMVHFNFKTGEITELNFPIDDLRTFHSFNVQGKDILVVGLDDRLAAVDLVAGKQLWITAEDDPQFEGYAHRYLKTEGGNIILTYSRAAMFSEEQGTYIFLMSIDAVTGKLNYRIPVLASKDALMDFQRSLGKIVMGAFSAVMTVGTAGAGADAAGQAMDMVNDMMGYDNIGLSYETFDHGSDNIVFFSGGSNMNTMNFRMKNPETGEEPGEGFVSVNYKTGKVNYKTYLEITSGLNGGEVDNLAPLAIYGNVAYKAGNERVVKVNLDSGELMWNAPTPDKLASETVLLDDGIMYVRYGKQSFDVKLKEDEVEMNGTVDVDPYGFLAIDDASGKVLWDVETSSDPGLLTPQFSIDSYYDSGSNHLYFADLQNLFALKLGKNGGSYDWKVNFESAGIGEIDYPESYAIVERWIGSVPRTSSTSTYIGGGWTMTTTRTTGGYSEEDVSSFLDEAESADVSTTYTSWGSIWGVYGKKCLRVLYGKDLVVVFGPEAYSLIKASDGSVIWKNEWDYDNTEVTFVPKIIGDKIVCCMSEQLMLVDLNTGKEIWNAEEDEKAKMFQSPDNKYFFSLYDEEISSYSINK